MNLLQVVVTAAFMASRPIATPSRHDQAHCWLETTGPTSLIPAISGTVD